MSHVIGGNIGATTTYTVEHHEYGITLSAGVPASETVALLMLWEKKYGYDVCDLHISGHLQVAAAVTTRAKAKLWREALGIDNPERLAKRDGQPMAPGDWPHCGDTGLSSSTIWCVMTGQVAMPGRSRFDVGDTPADPDDFGRCFRLLERFPGWKARMPEVAAKYPAWAGLVAAWDELEALYAQERPTGTAPKLYARMQELRTTT
jgi:hypothetical protein